MSVLFIEVACGVTIARTKRLGLFLAFFIGISLSYGGRLELTSVHESRDMSSASDLRQPQIVQATK